MHQTYERIEAFNAGRIPELKERKYRSMEASLFAFFRGTCHLFYEDWPAGNPLDNAPATWSCGDLHLENFGSYKGDNRLGYFDMNDFDEAVLAPATWDVARFLASLFVASSSLNNSETETITLAERFLDEYRTTLEEGHARSIERETAKGIVRDFLKEVAKRDRVTFLDARTTIKKSRRLFKTNGRRFYALADDLKEDLQTFMESFAAESKDPDFFRLIDVAGRIAGTGSLGLNRYALLVAGKRSPDANYILDMKLARPSALSPFLSLPQPEWENEAARVVAVQKRMQATPPAFLCSVTFRGEPYLMKGLQPSQDKIDLKLCKGKIRSLEQVIRSMGRVLAWDQLRSGGRQGSAIADELIDFARSSSFPRDDLVTFARSYSKKAQSDHEEFVTVRQVSATAPQGLPSNA